METIRKQLKIVVEKTDTGFSAFSADWPIYTTGASISALMNNALEAANLYFEEESITLKLEDITFELDFKQFFQYYKVLNSRFLAQKIGMNPTLLSQYVRGNKKPSGKQTAKIISGIHRIGQELSDISLIYRR